MGVNTTAIIRVYSEWKHQLIRKHLILCWTSVGLRLYYNYKYKLFHFTSAAPFLPPLLHLLCSTPQVKSPRAAIFHTASVEQHRTPGDTYTPCTLIHRLPGTSRGVSAEQQTKRDELELAVRRLRTTTQNSGMGEFSYYAAAYVPILSPCIFMYLCLSGLLVSSQFQAFSEPST